MVEKFVQMLEKSLIPYELKIYIINNLDDISMNGLQDIFNILSMEELKKEILISNTKKQADKLEKDYKKLVS